MALQPRFSNQGTLDWLALAKAPVNISLDVLTRYSKAGVDPSSVMAGQIVCSFIVMTPKAEKEVLEHLRKLPRVAMYGNVAKFGFGLQHVLEDLLQRDGGTSCLALCGCLTHSYDLFFGARVLRSLCERRKMPVELRPGVMQWKALLEPCNNIFSGSRFAKHVDEGFTPLLVERNENTGHCRLEATDPEELALALMLLADVASQRLESCVIRGGVDCAWLAAVAIFIFDLTIRIQTSDGRDVYQSGVGGRGPAHDAQIIFVKDDQPASTSIQVASRTFILPTGQDLLKIRPHEPGLNHRFLARSTWRSIIADAFGANTAERLLAGTASRHFAAFLIYLAHRQETLLGPPLDDDGPAMTSDRAATDQRLWPPEHPESKPLRFFCWPHLRHSPRSPFGADLLAFAAKCFPALRPSLDAAQRQNDGRALSRKTAKTHFEKLGQTCGCTDCMIGLASTGGKMDQCLCKCALVIVHWIRILSTTLVYDVLPTAEGFESMFDFVNTWDSRPVRGMSDHRIPLLLKLFIGTQTEMGKVGVGQPQLARSLRGICVLMGVLMDPSLGPDDVGVVHVVPGQLEYDGHLFQNVYQRRLPKPKLDTHLWPEFDLNPKRRFVLVVSDLQLDGVLEVGYQTEKSSPVGPFRSFELESIIDWGLSLAADFPVRCTESDGVYWLVEVGRGEEGVSTRKTSWNLELLTESGHEARQNNNNDNNNPDDTTSTTTTITNNLSSSTDLIRSRDHHHCGHDHLDDPSMYRTYSLLIILSPDNHSTLEIHKSSIRSGVGLEQFYAEYARPFYALSDGRTVQRDIVPALPDCARCIVHYVTRAWTRFVSPSTKLVAGQLYIHRSGIDSDEVRFELNRRDHDESLEKESKEVNASKNNAVWIGWLWWWWELCWREYLSIIFKR